MIIDPKIQDPIFISHNPTWRMGSQLYSKWFGSLPIYKPKTSQFGSGPTTRSLGDLWTNHCYQRLTSTGNTSSQCHSRHVATLRGLILQDESWCKSPEVSPGRHQESRDSPDGKVEVLIFFFQHGSNFPLKFGWLKNDALGNRTFL